MATLHTPPDELCIFCRKRPGIRRQITIEDRFDRAEKRLIIKRSRFASLDTVFVRGFGNVSATLMDREKWETFVAWIDQVKEQQPPFDIPLAYRLMHLPLCSWEGQAGWDGCQRKIGPLIKLDKVHGNPAVYGNRPRDEQKRRAYRRTQNVQWFTLRMRWRDELWDITLEASKADTVLCNDLKRAVEMPWEQSLYKWACHWHLPFDGIKLILHHGPPEGFAEPLAEWLNRGDFGYEWIYDGAISAVDHELRERLADGNEDLIRLFL